jgi:dTMP kinase
LSRYQHAALYFDKPTAIKDNFSMFIVFEGLDGAGKSTLIKGLEKELASRRIEFITSREPGGTELGDEIRQILLRCQGDTPLPRTELLLYEAGRAQHVDFVIRPALAGKKWVLCDRYDASSIAFQASGRGLNKSDVAWLNAFATGGLSADLYVLLDLTVEEGRRRREHRDADRFEREAEDFHERVRQGYLQLARAEAQKWCVLDASMTTDLLSQKLMDELRKRQWIAG